MEFDPSAEAEPEADDYDYDQARHSKVSLRSQVGLRSDDNAI
jgi:hypothetical protein